MQLNAYLMFNGRCDEAFKFYSQCLGGTITSKFTYGDAPPPMEVSPETRDLIMHARLEVGDAVLFGSDTPPDRYDQPKGLYVSLSVAEPVDADRIFSGLADGGTVQLPIQETFWASRFGMVVDRFGTPWMINCEKPE